MSDKIPIRASQRKCGVKKTQINDIQKNKIGVVSPVRRYEAPDRCTAAANVI